MYDGYTKEEVSGFDQANSRKLVETAISHSDAIIKGSEDLDDETLEMIKSSNLPTLEYSEAEYKEKYKPFYESLF
jgi:starch synthase